LCDAREIRTNREICVRTHPAHSSIWWSCVVFLIVYDFARLSTLLRGTKSMEKRHQKFPISHQNQSALLLFSVDLFF
jgi:hypothetical protein